MNLIIAEIKNEVGIITLNDTKHHNALSSAMISEMLAGFSKFVQNKLKAVVIRAPKGAKVWSAGHDVKELPKDGFDPLTYNDPLRKIVRTIQESPMPILAMIEGTVWGGACELAMSCDMIYAAEDTTFSITPAKIGVPYNLVGMVNFMKNISLPSLKELLFTARSISAKRAEMIGMISRAVPKEELEELIERRLEYIRNNAPLAISVMKEELKVLSESYPLNPESFEKIQAGRKLVYNSDDYKEGITAFFEKRKPNFKGQ